MCAALLIAACERRAPEPAPTPVKSTTIYDHIREGDTTGFIHWIEQSPDVNQKNEKGETPLICAILYDRLGYAIDLIGNGADPNLADPRGNNALHKAAQLGRTAAVPLLMEAGADILAINQDGLSPYDLAVIGNQTDAAIALAEARTSFFATEAIVATNAVEAIEPEIPPALLLSTDFREWTSASGKKMEAAFIRTVLDTVTLQDRGGQFFRIAQAQLSPADQILVRQLSGLDPHALARTRVTRAPAVAKTQADSMGLRISKESGWTVLENARLLKSSANDGDSFHVEHDGEEYIFRLYFVDAAETKMTYPDRVRDQADYFNLSKQRTIDLGEAAARYTTSLLAEDRFTVATQWEDAKGNSSLPRYYAMVITPQGDLDELLVQEGLVRRYGMPIRGSLGQKKQNRLKNLEEEAKSGGHGAWSKPASAKAASRDL